MPKLYRDVATFAVDFSCKSNNWLYRGLFQGSDDGTVKSRLEIEGIDEMKETLRKLENGTIRVVRRKQYEQFKYEPCKTREIEVKEMLRKKIATLENNYSEVTEGEFEGGRMLQR